MLIETADAEILYNASKFVRRKRVMELMTVIQRRGGRAFNNDVVAALAIHRQQLTKMVIELEDAGLLERIWGKDEPGLILSFTPKTQPFIEACAEACAKLRSL